MPDLFVRQKFSRSKVKVKKTAKIGVFIFLNIFFKKISKFRLQSFFGLGEDYMSRKFERPSSKTVGGDRFLKSYLEINVLMFNLLVAQTPDTCVDKMVTLWL